MSDTMNYLESLFRIIYPNNFFCIFAAHFFKLVYSQIY